MKQTPTGTYNLDGSWVIIPHTMEGGRPLSKDDAIAQYHRTGKHLGKFVSQEEANEAARALDAPELAKAITQGLNAVKPKMEAKADAGKAIMPAKEVTQRLKGSKARMEPRSQPNIHIHVNLVPETIGRLMRGKK